MKGICPYLWVCLAAITGTLANAQSPSIDETHWLRDEHGCLLYNPFPHPKPGETIRWSGSCKDGYGNGPGKLEWFDKSGASDGWRKGTFMRGNLEGEGEAVTVKGSHFTGTFRNGLRTGHGILEFLDGPRYEGQFLGDRANGHGIITWTDGTRFVGEFRNSKGVGIGTLILASGERYDGGFKDSRLDGGGTITWPDGSKEKIESNVGWCFGVLSARAKSFCAKVPTF